MKRTLLTFVCLLTALALVAAPAPVIAQEDNLVYEVQYSVPFGVVSGQLMLLGGYLVFVDSGDPAASFVIPRGQIAALNVDGPMVAVDSTGPIRDREGERTQFSFRLSEGTSTGPIVAWRSMVTELSTAQPGGPAIEMSYTVKHDHRFGSCRGQLIFRGDVLAYESIDDLGHSRRWAVNDVEKLEQKNPYELSVEPFQGNRYNFKLQGGGMEPADFQTLLERVTTARATRQ